MDSEVHEVVRIIRFCLMNDVRIEYRLLVSVCNVPECVFDEKKRATNHLETCKTKSSWRFRVLKQVKEYPPRHS